MEWLIYFISLAKIARGQSKKKNVISLSCRQLKMIQTISAEATGFAHFSNNCICLHCLKALLHLIYFFLCFNQVYAETVIILFIL